MRGRGRGPGTDPEGNVSEGAVAPARSRRAESPLLGLRTRRVGGHATRDERLTARRRWLDPGKFSSVHDRAMRMIGRVDAVASHDVLRVDSHRLRQILRRADIVQRMKTIKV